MIIQDFKICNPQDKKYTEPSGESIPIASIPNHSWVNAGCTLMSVALVLQHSVAQDAPGAAAAGAGGYDLRTPIGAHHRRVACEVPTPDTNGNIVPQLRWYTMLETGLNYQENGIWLPSEAQVVPCPEGAAAIKGQQKITFAHNIAQRGAIRITGSEGTIIKNNPVGLYFHDRRSGDSVRLATIRPTVGVIIPPNQVLYRDAFEGLRADLLYTYQKDQFEADVILRERPREPETFGMSSGTTDVEMLTEFLDSPEPSKHRTQYRQLGLKEGGETNSMEEIANDDIAFAEIQFKVGQAFSEKERRNTQSATPVRKTWETLGQRSVLREQLEFDAVRTAFAALPRNELPRATIVQAGIDLPVTHGVEPHAVQVMQLGELAQEDGFVIDYTTLSGSMGSFTFQASETYFVTNTFMVNGSSSCTFNSGAVIKFADTAEFLVAGNPAVSGAGATFTSMHDNSVGLPIAGSNGQPTQKAFTAFWFYYIDNSRSLSNHTIKYAGTAVKASANAGSGVQHAVQSMTLLNCGTGLSSHRNDSGTQFLINASQIGTCEVTNLVGGITNQTVLSAHNTCPTITLTSSTTTHEDVPLDLHFTVSDDTSPAASLVVEGDGEAESPWVPLAWTPELLGVAASSNTMRFIPALDSSGTGKWRVSATDTNGLTRVLHFDATVESVNDASTIGAMSAPRLALGLQQV
ncbi:MAG: hypothetical protein IT580_16845 [Verrucomicrobiales bacterium]|nr:hypothetical protein [Verrucomicrobiales bacterium]